MKLIFKIPIMVIFSPVVAVVGSIWFVTCLHKKRCMSKALKLVCPDMINNLCPNSLLNLVLLLLKANKCKVTSVKQNSNNAIISVCKKHLKLVLLVPICNNNDCDETIKTVIIEKAKQNANYAIIVNNVVFESSFQNQAKRCDVKLLGCNELVNIAHRKHKAFSYQK